MTAQKKISEHAQVAKLCKAYAQKLGLKCSASSDIFSGGTSVRVVIQDATLEQRKQIESDLAKYQYGHFDGMQDIYENSNYRKDIPQVKYLFTEFKYCDEIKQRAYDWARANFACADDDQLAESFSDVGSNARLGGEYAQTMVHQVLSGSRRSHDGEKFITFWDSYASSHSKPAANVVSLSGIVSVYHTKMNQDIFIVTIPEKLERADFDALLQKARSFGGWYSRKWGDSPSGFAFKDQASAEQFTDNSAINSTPAKSEPAQKSAPATDSHNANQAAKLRKIAESANAESSQKLSSRDTHTQKKLAQAMSAKIEGYRLERVANVALKLADMWESGTIAKNLRGFVTKKSLYDALIAETQQVPNGFHSYPIDTGKPHRLANLDLWALCENNRDEKAGNIQEIENKIKFSNIAGFFPTPANVCEIIANNIKPCIKAMQSPRVLEPQAGSGNLCEFAKSNLIDPKICAFELNATLAELVRLKGFDCTRDDFLQLDPNKNFDLVLMNPPFEKMADIDHVMHAHKFVKDGGQLIAVMSASFTFNQSKKAESFRDWLTQNDGHFLELPAGSFKSSGTMVNTVLVIINGGF